MATTSTDCNPNDVKLVERINAKLSGLGNIDEVSSFLKIISDPTRLKIILLLEGNEVSVNDIAVIMDMTKSAVSHQLKVLLDTGYLKSRKEGKMKYYTLYDYHILEIIQSAYNHVNHCE